MLRHDYFPRTRLSATAAHEEFLLPPGALSDHIAKHFDLVWLHHHGAPQPGIHHPGLHYPGHRPATLDEIDTYRAARRKMRDNGEPYLKKPIR